MKISKLAISCAIAFGSLASVPAIAKEVSTEQRNAIMENLKRLPELPKIKSISDTPMKNVFEVVYEGNNIFYTDDTASYILIEGNLVETKTMTSLTQNKKDALNKVEFSALPFKDSFVIKHGKGENKIAVFADPNCGYCKQLEKSLEAVDNVSIHVFLYPILNQDSIEKSKNLWCAKDKGAVWTDWMVKNKAIPASTNAKCDTSALERNIAFGKSIGVSGTPTIIFENGLRAPGAISAEQLNKAFESIKENKSKESKLPAKK